MPNQVLDHGFVQLVDVMGSDLRTVNSARISFGKHSKSLTEKDEALIKWLGEADHTAPFRHSHLTFHIKCPIFVMRQWIRYKVGSDFNEISGRYTEFNEYHLPVEFRHKDGTVFTGTDDVLLHLAFRRGCDAQVQLYRSLLNLGVCREQARMVLPLGLYTEAYWTASLQTVAHFIQQRTDSHAQWEIQQFALKVKELTAPLFPYSLAALLKEAPYETQD